MSASFANRRVTHLRFDDAQGRYGISERNIGDRMLSGVSDWIQDITRSSGMVRRIKIHIWKVVLGFREKFGYFPVWYRNYLEGSGSQPEGQHELDKVTWTWGVRPGHLGPGAPQPQAQHAPPLGYLGGKFPPYGNPRWALGKREEAQPPPPLGCRPRLGFGGWPATPASYIRRVRAGA